MPGHQRRRFEEAEYRTNHSHSGNRASHIHMELAGLVSAWVGRTNHRYSHHMCSHGRDMDQQRSRPQMSPPKQTAFLWCRTGILQTQPKWPPGQM